MSVRQVALPLPCSPEREYGVPSGPGSASDRKHAVLCLRWGGLQPHKLEVAQ
jgi:hypothetical protein